ncbi:MAG: hypothetical protein AMJ95_04550 [Omnitrophica WOR_2 bacterium SM23_72]|nr:MAG: hypothetical protein AMJ95_04550 [Omnitrophica WOR_2 bacterium SM23_72]
MEKAQENLTPEEVYRIRSENRNPDVAIGVNTHYGDLKKKNYKEAVEYFNKRIRDRYFDIGGQLSKRKKHKSGDIFVVMLLNCIIIDMLSQYRYGLEGSKQEKFKEFIIEYLSQHNHKLGRIIKSCSYKNSKWYSIQIKDMAGAIYHGFRCGLIHSGMLAEYARINETYKNDVIRIDPWKSDITKNDIIINPPLLMKKLKKAFKKYIQQLRHGKKLEQKHNFKRRFEFEFGFKLNE